MTLGTRKILMNSFLKKQMNLAKEKIFESKNIYIASHVQPDGDNLGSMLALGLALKKINENVYMVKTDPIPSDFMFLPGVENIKEIIDYGDVDLFITLDSSDIERLGQNKRLIDKANFVINIDHHISNTDYGDINIVDSTSGSTAELVFELINILNIKVDKDIGTCIYTGISTDTGSFMYDNTRPETHLIAAELLKIGIDKKNIILNVYQNKSIEKTKLFIKTIENLKTFIDNKVAVVHVTKDILRGTGAKMEDTDGIISFIRDIEPVEVAIVLKELETKEIKVSMRSKKYVNVSEICSKFNGGGHIRAAGCTIYNSLEFAETALINELKKIL